MAETKLQKITQRAYTLYVQNLEIYNRDRKKSFDFAAEQACKENSVTVLFDRMVLRSVISKQFGPYYFPPDKATTNSIVDCIVTLYHFGYWKGGDFDHGIDEAFRQYHVIDEFDRAVLKKLVGKELGLHNAARLKKLKREGAPKVVRPPKQLPFNFK